MTASDRRLGAGVLHPGAAAGRFSLNRHRPPEDLAPFLGIRFRPGGFRPFYAAGKISTLNDLVVPAAGIFGPAADRACAAVLAAASEKAMIAAGQDLLRAARPRPDPVVNQAHLTRDFTATLGMPPSRYAAQGR